MIISEMINKLNKIKKTRGDLKVFTEYETDLCEPEIDYVKKDGFCNNEGEDIVII